MTIPILGTFSDAQIIAVVPQLVDLGLQDYNFDASSLASTSVQNETSGSTVTSETPGFTINGSMLVYDGSQMKGAVSVVLTETLGIATHTTAINVTLTSPLTLGPLTFSQTAFTLYQAANGTINGATVGSTIVATGLPTGFAINSALRTWTYDGSGVDGSTTVNLQETLATANGSPDGSSITLVITGANATSPPIVASPTPVNMMGINISFFESSGNSSKFALQPDSATISHFVSRNLKIFRLCTNWTLWTAALDGPLVASYVANVTAAAQRISDAGGTYILDLHSYAQYGDGQPYIGTTGGPTVEQFANFWLQLATAIKGLPGLAFYGLMNEPKYDVTAGDDVTIWPVAAQAAINAIRTVDSTTPIICPGNHYDGSWDFKTQNPNLHEVVDPAGLMLFESHGYYDHDASGRFIDYDTEVATAGEAPPGVNTGPNIGVYRYSQTGNSFIEWLDAHQIPVHPTFLVRGLSTESGIPGNDDRWLVVLENTLDLFVAKGIGFFVWCVYPNASVTVDSFNWKPQDNGLQAAQMAAIAPFVNAPEPTLIQLTMPARMVSGQASSACVLTYRGNLKTAITVGLTELNANGFTTSVPLIIPAGRNPTLTFTVTPTTTAILRFLAVATGYTIVNNYTAGVTAEIDQQGTGAYIVSTESDPFVGISTLPTLHSYTHRLTTTWSGPVVLLRRGYDSAVKAFYATSDTDPRVDRTAISNWAGSNTATIHRVVAYDQSGQAHHNVAGADKSYSSLDGTINGGYEPLWVIDGGNGYPVERRASQRGAFPSDIKDSPPYGYTMIADMQYTSGKYLLPYTSNTLGSIGLTSDNFGIRDNTADVAVKGPNLTVATGLLTDAPHTYVYRFVANQVGGLQSFCDGTQVAATDTTASGPITFDRATCDEGWFRFSYNSGPMIGDIRNIIIAETGALTDAEIAGIQSSLTSIYTTAWPSITAPTAGYPPVATMAATTAWTVAQGKPVGLFAIAPVNGLVNGTDFALSDPNNLNVSISITLSAANGTLAGPGLTQDANNPLVYHMAADTAATIKTNLRGSQGVPGALFTPTVVGQTTTFALTFTNSANAVATNSSITVACVAVAPLDTPYPAVTFTALGNGMPKGWALSGGEANNQNSTNASNYTYGGTFELDYAAGVGINSIRFPLKMNRVQSNNYQALTGVLSIDKLKVMVDRCAANGQYAVLDLHEYGKAFDAYFASGSYVGRPGCSGDTVTLPALCDFWARLANKFKNYPNVILEIMNEPNGGGGNCPGLTAQIWHDNSVAIVAAIRATGFAGKILIPGNSGTNYANAGAWAGSQNTIWDNFTDSNFSFVTHQYLDSNSGGFVTTVGVNHAVPLLTSCSGWARDPARIAKGFTFFLTEFGWSYNDNQTSGGVPSTEGKAVVQYLKNNEDVWVGWNYWLGGAKALYKGYIFYAGPLYNSGNVDSNTTDSVQLPILQAGF